VKVLELGEARRRMAEVLGLPSPGAGFPSRELLAAVVRRVAAYSCPCPPGRIVRTTLAALEGLVPEPELLREDLEDTLEALISYGDLGQFADLSDVQQGAGRNWLGIMPPSFFVRASGTAYLLGLAPGRTNTLPEEIASRVALVRHVRSLEPLPGEDLAGLLRSLGLFELSARLWLRSPKSETAIQHVTRLNLALDRAPGGGLGEELLLLDPSRSPRYYPGRWVEAASQTGRFVGRRPQAYGADLWCYVELALGAINHLLDLPLSEGLYRGCDEAWRLQAAIDHTRGTPQLYRRRVVDMAGVALDVYSPVPVWVRRRWEAIGRELEREHCLISYRFKPQEVDEEVRALCADLWLEAEPAPTGMSS
jgi:hypothetical protein